MNHGEHNPVDPAKIQTEVFRLPTTVFAEENGSLGNSGRKVSVDVLSAMLAGVCSAASGIQTAATGVTRFSVRP